MTEKEFTQNWIEKLKPALKIFPDDFLGMVECELITLPGKILFLNPPFFGSYQITEETGNVVYSTDEHFKAKYVIYSNRTKPLQLKIPIEAMRVYETVRDYEKHLDSFLKEMEKDFKSYYPNSKSFRRISAQVFNSLNLLRQ